MVPSDIDIDASERLNAAIKMALDEHKGKPPLDEGTVNAVNESIEKITQRIKDGEFGEFGKRCTLWGNFDSGYLEVTLTIKF